MNPYDFVSLGERPRRKPYKEHHKFDGRAGVIKCSIETKTPIFISDGSQVNPMRFITKGRKPIIPGSSLKGLLRSVAEAAGNGCMLLFDGLYEKKKINYSRNIPREFQKCTTNKSICPCCRMFGMMSRSHGDLSKGNVTISDAIIEGKPDFHPMVIIPALMTPKPRHDAFYLSGERIAGRKFFFHHPQGIKTDERITKFNKRIQPLDRGSRLLFEVSFSNLEDEELSLLLYSIALEPNMCHKIGMGKPVGLGSIKIRIEEIVLYDLKERYKSIGSSSETREGTEILKGEDKDKFVKDKTKTYRANNAQNLLDLRRIWKFDPNDRTDYRYPTTDWFNSNSQVPISQTP